MENNDLLPAGFDSLRGLVPGWVLPDSQARCEKRRATAYSESKTFYDTVLGQAPAALEYLQTKQLGELSDADERLLKLLLALAEIGPAVEWYAAPISSGGFDPDRFRLTTQLTDSGAQGVTR